MRSLEELIVKYKPLGFLRIVLDRKKKKKREKHGRLDII
jgi:hypothetical protein